MFVVFMAVIADKDDDNDNEEDDDDDTWSGEGVLSSGKPSLTPLPQK